MSEEKKSAVEWLAEKYNYVTWMRNRDEISAGMADAFYAPANEAEPKNFDEYYKKKYEDKNRYDE